MNIYGTTAMQTYGIFSTKSESNRSQQYEPTVNADDVMGKDDFLKLLVTQLSYQDPLDPVNDQEFIAQLAQFSSLEQMQNVSKGIEDLVDVQLMFGGMTQAASLLGRTVVLTDYETGEPIEGVVDAARLVEGVPIIVVGGVEYSLWDVEMIKA